MRLGHGRRGRVARAGVLAQAPWASLTVNSVYHRVCIIGK
jgi:hypothetical protein